MRGTRACQRSEAAVRGAGAAAVGVGADGTVFALAPGPSHFRVAFLLMAGGLLLM